MSEHDPFPPEQGSRTEGPFSDQYHVLIVDGRRVPNVQVYPHDDGTVGGEVAPGRLLVDCQIDEVLRGLVKLDGRSHIDSDTAPRGGR